MLKVLLVAYGEVRLHSDLRLIVGGALPLLPTYCPYRARYLLNPVHGGDPGCRSLRSLYPGLRYHCPYRAPRVQNLRRSALRFALTLLCEVRLHLSITLKTSFQVLHSVCTDIALTGRRGFKTSVALHCGWRWFKCKKNFEHLLLPKKKEDLCYSLGRIWRVSITV